MTRIKSFGQVVIALLLACIIGASVAPAAEMTTLEMTTLSLVRH
jgi:hypothetical protein